MHVRKEKRSGMVREEEERHRSGGRENDGKCEAKNSEKERERENTW